MAFATDTNFGEVKDTQWWVKDLTTTDRHIKMMAAIKKIQVTQLWRKQSDLQHLRLYGNAPIVGLGISNYTKPSTLSGGRVGLNVVRACSDALTAKLCSDEMKARLLTSGADWDLQQRAQEIEKFLDGQRAELDIDEWVPWWVLQACIFGTGALKIFTSGEGKRERIKIEGAPIWSIQVDDQEALYGKPPTFYQRLWYDRQTLRSMFKTDKKARDLINRAKLQTDETLDTVGHQATADQILVTEAWHLPSFIGSTLEDTDGMHSMSLENGLLFSDPYCYDEPPFVFYTLWPQPLGFFGVGMVQQIQGLQVELNVLMQKVQRAFHLLGGGHLMIEKSSKVNKHKLDNDIGTIWEYMGTAPEMFAANPVPPQIFEHMDRIYTRAFETAGISQLEAASMKPRGLNSGRAIDSYLDITTERFNVCQRRLQKAFIRLNKWVLRLATEISERNPKFGTLYSDKSHAEMIHFQKNFLEDNQYVMQLYPTNALSDDPSEKISQVEKMVNGGWIDSTTARRLADFPDLEEFDNLDMAAFNAVEMCISAALKEERYIGPERFLPIGTPDAPGVAIKQVQNALIRAWVRKCPESKLRLLKRWLSDAVSLMQQQQVQSDGQPSVDQSAGESPERAGGGPGQPPVPGGPGPAAGGKPPGTA
jgi:hypothetical protein